LSSIVGFNLKKVDVADIKAVKGSVGVDKSTITKVWYWLAASSLKPWSSNASWMISIPIAGIIFVIKSIW
jgi:hypothetical protein